MAELFFALIGFAVGVFVGYAGWAASGRRNAAPETTEVGRGAAAEADAAEVAELRSRLAAAEERAALADQLRARLEALEAEFAAVSAGEGSAPPTDVTPPGPAAEPQEPLAADTVVQGDPEAQRLVAGLAEPDTPDDLTRVDGVGRKMASALNDAGITTYVALAHSSEDALRDAIKAAGLRFAPTLHTWPRQAAYLAHDDEDGREAYLATMTGS